MNGVGWLQKSAVCGKIDSYGASQGYFRCKSGRECHAGERFHVLVLHECRRFRTPCVLLHRSPTVSHAMRPFTSLGGDFVRHAFTSLVDGFACYACAFTSNGGDFTHCARFYIARRRFRTPCALYIARRRFRVLRMCFLHRTAVISHTAPCFTSLGDDFARRASFYIARRRFRVLRVCFLHRPAVISCAARPFTLLALHRPAVILRTAHASTSLVDGFACYACAFYIARR